MQEVAYLFGVPLMISVRKGTKPRKPQNFDPQRGIPIIIMNNFSYVGDNNNDDLAEGARAKSCQVDNLCSTQSYHPTV